MKKSIYVLIAVLIIIAVTIKLKKNKEAGVARVYTYDSLKPIPVKADTIRYEGIYNQQSVSGVFEPYKETKISSDIQGKVNEVFVDAGAYVKKGQLLIQLENALLSLQLQSIEIQIEGLEADVKRYTSLAEEDAIQRVQLEKALLALRSANVQRSTVKEQINKTTITSPFDGIVTAKLTEQGSFAAPGVPLLQISDIGTLRFVVNVAEAELPKFQRGNSFTIRPDAFPELTLPGKITLISSKTNNANSFPIHLTISNTPQMAVKAGMFGKVYFADDNSPEGFIIPASSIVMSGSKENVYLVKNGKAILSSIKISQRFKDKVVISEGLKEGDVIITNGFLDLKSNASVAVK